MSDPQSDRDAVAYAMADTKNETPGNPVRFDSFYEPNDRDYMMADRCIALLRARWSDADAVERAIIEYAPPIRPENIAPFMRRDMTNALRAAMTDPEAKP